MPFCKIPPEKLPFLELFGFRVIKESDTLLYVSCDMGNYLIEKKSPWIPFESPEDAMQLGAVAIITSKE